MIETSQLQTLVAVSKAKSFSKAAEDLNVTQSAISQSIKNLESKLEIKIFIGQIDVDQWLIFEWDSVELQTELYSWKKRSDGFPTLYRKQTV